MMNRCFFRCLEGKVLIADLKCADFSETAQTPDACSLLQEDFEKLLLEYKGKFSWILLSLKEASVLRAAEIHVIMDVFRTLHMKLTDVPAGVYDLIIQSGIYGRFEVLKELRTIDCSQLKLVGEGYTSKVYIYGARKVLKAFKPIVPLDMILDEREKSRYLFMSGARAPIAYELVKTHEKYGVVFEDLGKENLDKVFRDAQWDHHDLAKKYGALIRQMSVPVGRDAVSILENESHRFLQGLRDCKDLVTADQYARVQAELKKVPKVNHLLHGDCHAENVMIVDGHLFLIDAMTLAHGHPVFDLLCPYMYFNIWPEYKEIYDARTAEDEKAHPDWYGYISRYENNVVDKKEGEQLWKDFLHGYFGDRDEDFFEKVTAAVRILNYIKFGCYAIRQYIPADMMWGYNNWAMKHFDEEEGIAEEIFREWN